MTDIKSIDLENPTADDLRVIDAHVDFGIVNTMDCSEAAVLAGLKKRYSSDPAFVFEIVEGMRAKGWFVEITQVAVSGWIVQFIRDKMSNLFPSMHGASNQSVALAVCIAALRAMKVL